MLGNTRFISRVENDIAIMFNTCAILYTFLSRFPIYFSHNLLYIRRKLKRFVTGSSSTFQCRCSTLHSIHICQLIFAWTIPKRRLSVNIFLRKECVSLYEKFKYLMQFSNWEFLMPKNGNGVLLLTGPPGSGKTATLRVLAKELGVEIQEWVNPSVQSNGNGTVCCIYCMSDSFFSSAVQYVAYTVCLILSLVQPCSTGIWAQIKC